MSLASQSHALDLPAAAVLAVKVVDPLASANFPIGPYANGKIEILPAKGQKSAEAWRLNGPTLTTLQILEPLRLQLVSDGFDIAFECKDDDCGGFDFRYEIDLLPEPEMHVDLGDFRYLTATKTDAELPTEYVSLMVSRSANAGFVQISRIGAKTDGPSSVVASTKSGATNAFVATVANGGLAGRLESIGRAALEDLTFSTGSASLGGETFRSLSELADYLKLNPSKTVALVGHTDSEGSLAGNISLSRKRAASVLERLVSQHNVPRAQLEADGVGYLSPRASNLSDEGRTQNRRVEVILTSTQ